MDNFNYQAYLKSGKIHGEQAMLTESEQVSEKKYKQGYDDREDESLGARRGAEKGKKQSMKDRRDDSYGKFGKRDAEAKGKAKGPGKNKINKESAPGYKHDCAAHVMHESHGYGLCLEGRHTLVETTDGNAEVTHYDVMFKSGNIVEKIPVNELKVLTSEAHSHGKEEELEEVGKGYFKKEHGVGKKGFKMDKRDLKETIAEAKAKIDEGSYPFDQCLSDNEGKYGAKGAARVCGAIRAAYGEGLVKEDARTDAEQEGYKDGFNDAKDDIEGALKKMKVSELKDKIKTEIVSALSEQEEEVDVDIDVEDEVEVEAGADDIEIERPGVKAKVEVGLSPEEEIVQDSLKAAMDAADALGSQKLADQIGNTITFFTREFVVGNQSD
tara:strand:- start:2272 stop:3420 length:1149 start_codon:yes stop_codon:yes gene_type:complete